MVVSKLNLQFLDAKQLFLIHLSPLNINAHNVCLECILMMILGMIGVKLMSILQIKDVLIIPLNLYMITITVLNVMTQNNIETITLAPVTLGMNV